MQTKNNSWFIILFVLVWAIMFIIVSFVIINTITKNDMVLDNQYSNFSIENNYLTNLKNIETYENITSSWWSSDYFYCSWGVMIKNTISNDIICNGIITPWSDNIDDNLDNNDDLPTYYTWVNINNFISPDTPKYDDDVMYRLKWFWFLWPKEKKSIFIMNNDTINFIQNNKNNIVFLTPLSVDSWNMNMSISNIWTWNVIMETILTDKYIFNKSKDIYIKDKKTLNISSFSSSWIIDNFWNIGTTNIPYIFNFIDNDYIITLENTTDNFITYNYNLYQNNIPVYIIPVAKKDSKIDYLYQYFDGNKYYTK